MFSLSKYVVENDMSFFMRVNGRQEKQLFFFYIYNLHFFKQRIYGHQVLIYLNVPRIPVRKPLQNRQIDS